MPRRLTLFLTFLIFAAIARAETSWMGIYLQGQKVGYSRTEVSLHANGGETVDTETIMKTAMLGAAMEMNIKSSAVYHADGSLKSSFFRQTSGGRTLTVNAKFESDKIIAEQTSGGPVVKKEIPIPKGVKIVDDPTNMLLGEKGLKAGEARKFTVFDATNLNLIEMTASIAGEQQTEIRGKSVKAKLIKIDDPRAPMTVFLDESNNVLKMTGPVGLEMYPESEAAAKNLEGKLDVNTGPIDLADASSIKPDKPIQAAASRTSLTLRLRGADLGRTPGGDHQTVKKEGDAWLVTIHPVDIRNAQSKFQIGEVPEEYKSWIQPDVRIPSTSPEFVKKARELVGSEKSITKAAEKIRQHVYRTVRVNAGIGVLRDATEVMASNEGVCRDHAVLVATLCRAAGIPTRLVNGLVYADGRFWYHAWVEVFDGDKWYGMDSTRPAPRLTAGHIKTSEGTVAQAFTSFLLDGAKIEVVEGAAGASGK